MTEAEWLKCKRPSEMLLWLDTLKVSERKVMLFLTFAWKDESYQYPVETIRLAEGLDCFVDGAISREELHSLRSGTAAFTPENARYWIATASPACKVACRAIRDIFGNPFRPVAFDPAWRTDTAVSLASQMYESRDFGAMPILADALQDAGCDSADVLDHCRDPHATHVRGCWVVDLVLGKA